jgi:thymidylate synthase (FAD)
MVKLLQHTGWETSAYAARTCYESHNKSDYEADFRLLKNCIKRGHESVLEHTSMTWVIECTRACSHQLVRHRIASYSQQSQRYCKLDDNKDWFAMPEVIEKDYEEFVDVMITISDYYNKLISKGIKPEDARSVLPNCTLTTLVVTMNLRSFRNFLNLRLDRHAQGEIRELAKAMLYCLPDNLQELSLVGLTYES